MSEHTPGPWWVSMVGEAMPDPPPGLSEEQRAMWETARAQSAPRPSRGNDGAFFVVDEAGQVAEVAYRGDAPRSKAHDAPDPEGEANARLIAAAPELLEALRGMVEHVEGEMFARGSGNVEHADDDPAVDATRAAIAKATRTPPDSQTNPAGSEEA